MLMSLQREILYSSNRRMWQHDRIPADVERCGTDYDFESYFGADAIFSVSDAISLAMLKCREELLKKKRGTPDRAQPYLTGRSNFYSLALCSVGSGLALPDPEYIERVVLSDVSSHIPIKRNRALTQLLRVRLHVLSFQNEIDGLLEGDLWGTRAPFHMDDTALTPGQTEAVELARDWYLRNADALMKEISSVDRAICSLLGWDVGASLAYSELRLRHDFPDALRFIGEFCLP